MRACIEEMKTKIESFCNFGWENEIFKFLNSPRNFSLLWICVGQMWCTPIWKCKSNIIGNNFMWIIAQCTCIYVFISRLHFTNFRLDGLIKTKNDCNDEFWFTFEGLCPNRSPFQHISSFTFAYFNQQFVRLVWFFNCFVR